MAQVAELDLDPTPSRGQNPRQVFTVTLGPLCQAQCWIICMMPLTPPGKGNATGHWERSHFLCLQNENITIKVLTIPGLSF